MARLPVTRRHSCLLIMRIRFPGSCVTPTSDNCIPMTSTNTPMSKWIGAPRANEWNTYQLVSDCSNHACVDVVPGPSGAVTSWVFRSSGYGILGVRRHGGDCTFRRDDVAPWPTNRRLATMIISCRCNTCVFYGSPDATGQHIGLIMSAVWGVDGDSKYSSAERRMVWQ